MTLVNLEVADGQSSAQIEKSDLGSDDFDTWCAKNGANTSWTSVTQTLVGSTEEKYIAAWNFMVSAHAGDYFELMWSSPDTFMRLVAAPAQVSPACPGVPSVIVSVMQVR